MFFLNYPNYFSPAWSECFMCPRSNTDRSTKADWVEWWEITNKARSDLLYTDPFILQPGLHRSIAKCDAGGINPDAGYEVLFEYSKYKPGGVSSSRISQSEWRSGKRIKERRRKLRKGLYMWGCLKWKDMWGEGGKKEWLRGKWGGKEKIRDGKKEG